MRCGSSNTAARLWPRDWRINGGGTFRGFFDYAGVLNLDDLTIADAVATGGRGGTAEPVGFSDGAGGGGAGLGGGLFVASAGT